MDDSWLLRHADRPYSQNSTNSAAAPLKQSDSGTGRLLSPYVAQEFSVVDRNNNGQQAMAFNPQNSQSKAGRRELSNMYPTLMTWENLQQFRSSAVQQNTSVQSSFVASSEHPFASLCGLGGGFPLSVSGCLLSGGFEASGAAVGHLQNIRGQGLVHLPVTGVFENVGSALLRSSNTETSKQALSLGQRVYETGLQSQCASTFWQMDNGIAHRQTLRTSKHAPLLNRNTKPPLDVSAGLSHHQVSSRAPQYRPRVYCASVSGSIIVGEINISETGGLGVMCFCHNRLMSVACFSEHAGHFNVNPGVVVRMESGETLLQWRNTLFSQFGVKAMEDHIGWVWDEASSKQLEPSKRKGGTLQREVALSCESGPFTAKDRVGAFDNVCSSQIKCLSEKTTSKEGCPQSHDRTFSENVLRNFRKPFKQNNGVDSMLDRVSFCESIPGNSDGVLSRLILSNSTVSTPSIHNSRLISENSSCASTVNTSCVTTLESSSGLCNKPSQKSVDYSGWNYSQKIGHAEKDRVMSNFELRLGQPSQHKMSLGSTFSNCSQSMQIQGMAQCTAFGNAFVIDRAGQLELQHNVQSRAEQSAAEQTNAFSVLLGQGKDGLLNKNHPENVMKSRELQTWALRPKIVEGSQLLISSDMPEVVAFGDVRHRHDQDLQQGATLATQRTHHAPPQCLGNASNGELADTQISYFAQTMPMKNFSEESRNFFVNTHCQNPNSQCNSRVGMETRIENFTKGFSSPSPCIPHERSSFPVTDPSSKAFSVSESLAEKTGETHAAALDSGASCSSHTCWMKRNICDADSEAISSCNQNLSAACETINQGTSEQGRVVEDDSEVVETPKNSVGEVSGGSTDLAHTGNPVHIHVHHKLDCIDYKEERFPRDFPMEKVESEHYSCVKRDTCLGCRDADDPENLVHQNEGQSSLQQADAPSKTFEPENICTEEMSKSSELVELKDESAKAKDPFLKEEAPFDTGIGRSDCLDQTSMRELPAELGCKKMIYDNTNDENSGTGKCSSSEGVDMQTRSGSWIEESPTASSLVRQDRPPFHASSPRNFDMKSMTISTKCVSLFETEEHVCQISPKKASGLGKTCPCEEGDMSKETTPEPTYEQSPEQVFESQMPMPYSTSKEEGCSDRLQIEDRGPKSYLDPKIAPEKLHFKADQAHFRDKNRRKVMKQNHLDAVTSKGARKVHPERQEDRDPTSPPVGGAVLVTNHTPPIKSLKRKRSMMKCSCVSNVQQKNPGVENRSCLTHIDAKHQVEENCQKLVIKLTQMNEKQAVKTTSSTAKIYNHPILKSPSLSSLAREGAPPHKIKHEEKVNISSRLVVSSRFARNAHKDECIKAVKMASLSDILNRPREDKNIQPQHELVKQSAVASRQVRKAEAGKCSNVEKMMMFTGSASDIKEVRQRSLYELRDVASYSTTAAKIEFVENVSTVASVAINPRTLGGATKTLGPKERVHITHPPARPKKKKRFMASVERSATGLSSVSGSLETKALSRLARKPKFQSCINEVVDRDLCSDKVRPIAVVENYQVMGERKESTCSEASPNSHHRKQKRVHFDVRSLEEHVCCVCGRAHSESSNVLMSCSHCGIYVHQACYGIVKVPKAYWLCRICKVSAWNAVCVLCGYTDGAMTRAAKSQGITKELQQAWQVEKGLASRLHYPHTNGHSSIDGLLPPRVCAGCQFESCTCRSKRLHGSGKEVPDSYRLVGCTVNGIVYENSKYCKEEGSSTCHSGPPSLHDGIQWVHVVCALWMPGTRCLNVTNMSAFDVSGVASARKKLVCSLCRRPGGACITCHVGKCSTPFHPWCAHVKGLLQNVSFDEKGGKVGFFGKCTIHRNEPLKSMEVGVHSELGSQKDLSASMQITRQEHTVFLSICKKKRSSRKYIKRKICNIENGP